jgi:hypothetical protein
LIADSPGGAERVYRADLDRHPDNGWSLYGLAESLRRQRRGEEAALFEARFRTAWRDADLAQPDARY